MIDSNALNLWASLVAQIVKNLHSLQERILGFGWEDPLEKGMATHSAWGFQGQRSLTGYSPWDCKESDKTERL